MYCLILGLVLCLTVFVLTLVFSKRIINKLEGFKKLIISKWENIKNFFKTNKIFFIILSIAVTGTIILLINVVGGNK